MWQVTGQENRGQVRFKEQNTISSPLGVYSLFTIVMNSNKYNIRPYKGII